MAPASRDERPPCSASPPPSRMRPLEYPSTSAVLSPTMFPMGQAESDSEDDRLHSPKRVKRVVEDHHPPSQVSVKVLHSATPSDSRPLLDDLSLSAHSQLMIPGTQPSATSSDPSVTGARNPKRSRGHRSPSSSLSAESLSPDTRRAIEESARAVSSSKSILESVKASTSTPPRSATVASDAPKTREQLARETLERRSSTMPLVPESVSVVTDAPSSRWGHAVSMLSVGRLALLGGEDDGGRALGDVWTLDLHSGEWRLERLGEASDAASSSDTASFAPRVWHNAAMVASGGPTRSLLVFGGERDVTVGEKISRKQLQEPWLLIESTSSSMLYGYSPATRGVTPAGRGGHAMTHFGDSVVVHGGISGSRWRNDAHRLDLTTYRWHSIKTVGEEPCARCYHTAVTVDDAMIVVFGGNDVDSTFNDVFVLRTASLNEKWTWERMSVTGEIPRARTGHTATMVSSRHMMVVGGWDPVNGESDESCPKSGRGVFDPVRTSGGPLFPDAFVLDVTTWEWSRVTFQVPSDATAEDFSSLHASLARTGHAATLCEEFPLADGSTEPRLLLAGGVGPDEQRRMDVVALPLPTTVLESRNTV
jgi:hypothetical protein